jgi:uncharacterized protein
MSHVNSRPARSGAKSPGKPASASRTGTKKAGAQQAGARKSGAQHSGADRLGHRNPSPKRLGHPLVFDTRTLGPGSVLRQQRTAPAPADLGVELAEVPEGGELTLEVQLEGVTEGVLVTATVTAPVTGECARCLEPVSTTTTTTFRELYGYEETEDTEDGGYLLDGDLLDLEPALRDALVLGLPLAPLCADDCAGLCAECGVRLADAGPDHDHEDRLGGQPDTGGTPLPDETTPAGAPRTGEN